MSSLARPAVAVALFVGLAFACTNTIEGLPPEDDLAGGGASAGAGVVNGSATGSASGGTTGVAGSASPSGGASGSGTPGASGTSPDPIGTGGTSSGGASTGGASTGGASTGGTSTGGSGFAGSAQAGSGAGSFGGRPGSGNTTGGSTGIAGSGTPGSAGAPGGASGFAAVTAIITRTCATAMCHGGRRNPNLSAANLYTTLTSTAVPECGNDRLVTPGDTANSAFLQLVNGQCGELLMPATCDAPPCLEAPDMKTISDWIAAGAPR